MKRVIDHRPGWLSASLALVSLLLLGLLAVRVATQRSAPPDAGLRASELASRTARGCPAAGARRLPPAGIASATRAALRSFGDQPARARFAAVASSSGIRGRPILTIERCGRRVFRRTVVVFLHLPRLGFSASLSQAVVYVSRFADGYRVWEQIH